MGSTYVSFTRTSWKTPSNDTALFQAPIEMSSVIFRIAVGLLVSTFSPTPSSYY